MSAPIDVKQVIYALSRAEHVLQAQADALHDQRDYSAEIPAADAERMREAIMLLELPPLRDDFAMAALPTVLDTQARLINGSIRIAPSDDDLAVFAAAWAYKYADAMLAHRALGAKPDDFRQRVRDEHAALVIKIDRLDDFFATSMYEALPEAERVRLARQIGPMMSYRNILAERIAAFPA